MHRQHLDEGLSTLKQTLLTMASYAEDSVTNAIKALIQRDDALALHVEESDSRMDRLEIEMDEMAITVLAHAPLASDLRLVMVAVKISHDLERVGDEATTISRRVRKLNGEPQLKPYTQIPKMAEMAVAMLREALDAFVRGDSAKARTLIPRDKEVDAIHKGLLTEFAKLMEEHPGNIGRCLHLMVISKSLERIADHATNIAEEVVYLYEGRDIRHTGKGAAEPAKTENSGGR